MTNRRDRSLREELTLSASELALRHIPPKGPPLDWSANPHWVTVTLRQDGPVENYLTLRAAGREVELGRFLTPEEREALYNELSPLLHGN